jgi:hypothetical protein
MIIQKCSTNLLHEKFKKTFHNKLLGKKTVHKIRLLHQIYLIIFRLKSRKTSDNFANFFANVYTMYSDADRYVFKISVNSKFKYIITGI